ncbi:MAG: c-type cytochrome [Pseudomonadota bacterium]
MVRTYVSFGLAVFLLNTASANPWSEDMRDQPSVKPQETQVTTAPAAVPAGGKELVQKPTDLTNLVNSRLAAGADLENPHPRTPESVNRGKQVYDLHCLVCHGSDGHGGGAVGKKFVPPPMDLTLQYVQIQPDGQLFFTISRGSIAMPYYRDVITQEDRWHIVNYIKNVLGQQ